MVTVLPARPAFTRAITAPKAESWLANVRAVVSYVKGNAVLPCSLLPRSPASTGMTSVLHALPSYTAINTVRWEVRLWLNAPADQLVRTVRLNVDGHNRAQPRSLSSIGTINVSPAQHRCIAIALKEAAWWVNVAAAS